MVFPTATSVSVSQSVQRGMCATRRQANAIATPATGGGPVTSAPLGISSIRNARTVTVTRMEPKGPTVTTWVNSKRPCIELSSKSLVKRDIFLPKTKTIKKSYGCGT